MNQFPKSSLSYEHLEQRDLLAGDVMVVEDGHLYIRGDELANQIAIVADESGNITVEGLRGTTINGSSEPFQVNNSLDLGGAKGRNAFFEGGLRIKTLGGNDRVDVRGIEFGDMSRVITGEGDDRIRLMKTTSHHDFRAVTGEGHDTLNFLQTRVRGDFDVKTTSGNDSISIRNSRTWGETSIASGTGDDWVGLEKFRLSGDSHRVMTSDGADEIVVRNNNVNDSGLEIFAGDGRDHVFAEMNDSNEVEGEITVAGQNGFDILEIDADASMMDRLDSRGFVHKNTADGIWYAYDRGQDVAVPDFTHRATAVEFDETTRIRSMDWLGAYFNSEAPDIDNFAIEIFESEAVESHGGGYWFRQPDMDSVVKFEVGNEVDRIDTGEFWTDVSLDFELGIVEGDSRKIFSYSADIDFEFLADKTYWVSIYAYREASENPHQTLNDYDFGVLLDYPGKPGELRDYVQPQGTQDSPFRNTNAIMFDDNAESGLAPDSWYFNSSDVKTLMALNR